MTETPLMLTLSHQPALLGWAAAVQGNEGPWDWGLDAIAMGAVDRATGKVAAVMVMNSFFDDSCYVHIASDGARRWASPHVLRSFFGFMFDVKKVSRVIGVTPSENTAAVIAVIKLGFTIEGRIRSTRDGKKANIVSVMFREDCPWLDQPQIEGVPEDGQEIRTGS